MIEAYRKARKVGKKQVKKARAEGRYPFLSALDEQPYGQTFARETSVGSVEIPLAHVAGTKTRGRKNVFSEGFMPLEDEDSEFAAKWSRLYDTQVAEGFRDPITVYECLHRFYVQEGNKRVSVARHLGMPTIMAHVTRVVPMPGTGVDDELARYEEFERFYAVAPLYDVVLSHEGDYAKLAHLVGRDLQCPWSEDDIRWLKSAFHVFTVEYERQGGSRLALPVSDAFLLYLQTHVRTDGGHVTPAVVNKRIRLMRGELEVASRLVAKGRSHGSSARHF